MKQLYISNYCPLSHRCLYLIYSKNIQNYFQIINITYNKQAKKNISYVPYFLDNHLEIYNPQLICEYIDDIFKASPFLTNDFVKRAKIRQTITSFDNWIIPNLNYLELNKNLDKKNIKKNFFIQKIFKNELNSLSTKQLITKFEKLYTNAKNKIINYFFQLNPILNKQNYLIGNSKSLLDITIIPVLWHLQENYQINFETIFQNDIFNNFSPLIKYCKKNFQDPTFIQTLQNK